MMIYFKSVLPILVGLEYVLTVWIRFQLINIAKYYNKDWEPDWNNQDEYKYFIIYDTDTYKVDYSWTVICNNIYFKNKKDAQTVIDNPNSKDILNTIYKN